MASVEAHGGDEGSPALSRPAPHIAPRLMFEFCDLLYWLSFKYWSRRLWRGLNRAGNRPDEVHHRACNGDIDDVSVLAARAQPTISGAQSNLRLPPDIANDFWQRLDPVDLCRPMRGLIL